MATRLRVTLGTSEARRLVTAVESALSGEYTDGDFGWTEREAAQARNAAEKLKAAIARATQEGTE